MISLFSHLQASFFFVQINALNIDISVNLNKIKAKFVIN